MMVSSSKIVFLVPMLITILVALQVTNGEYKSEGFFPAVNVAIRNNMSDTPLRLHCKDKNKDDGFHTLNYGEIHSFSVVYVPYVGHCLWFCRFSWGHFKWEREYHYFDIFVQNRDVKYCPAHCNWSINRDGACRITETSFECFPWNYDENNALNV
ncbi:unnamed protein product [Lathyrus oleraceus]|uniref:S-protein homolog 19-like n=1 Tax=Pisum sativum TaxID=3888 RepID=UPI0021CE20C8|nr:S-protein homolog 19-like [Pisum sativum]